jgi:hypothetical protein
LTESYRFAANEYSTAIINSVLITLLERVINNSEMRNRMVDVMEGFLARLNNIRREHFWHCTPSMPRGRAKSAFIISTRGTAFPISGVRCKGDEEPAHRKILRSMT